MNASQRLVFNTAATYGRSVFTLVLALLSSRWVLNSLGQVDYGLFSLVGSLIVFITFLNGYMASSVSRYFAYSLGQGDSQEVRHWFNTALGLHSCLAFTLVLVGWPLGEYVIAHVFNIPPERISASLWTFRVSLVSAFVSMVSIPFVAMFTAQQRIAEMAAWGVLHSVLVLSLAYVLTRLSGDLLLFYAVGMVAIVVLIQVAMVVRALSVFPECRLGRRDWFDGPRFKEILSFAVWNLIGGTGVTFRDQGTAILLNLFFGPRMNAAFGIAKQVSVQTNQLSTAMIGAFTPEITASEGRGDRRRMLDLSHRASKFGTILVILFAVPLMAEMDYVLQLWLREPPPYTTLFCRLVLCTFLLNRLSIGYYLAVNAHGKVAAYQATVGTSLVLTLPLAWLFLHWGGAPGSVGVAFLLTAVVCTAGRVLWLQRLFGEPIGRWLGTVVLPCLLVCATAAGAALLPRELLPMSLARLVLATSLSVAASLLATWLVACDPSERAFVRRNCRQVLAAASRTCSRRERVPG
ncbi:MAG: hypothetical protein MUC88_14975 [Planctomycetes bacterium]|jgi:O-antigen/teichoic acid export membrane protein|nr:hypothetical protein [Planctomycetota bacterium]